MFTFDNDRINYAIIAIGDRIIEGECNDWRIGPSGTATYMKLMIEGKQYIVGINNVILTEK